MVWVLFGAEGGQWVAKVLISAKQEEEEIVMSNRSMLVLSVVAFVLAVTAVVVSVLLP